MTILEKEQSKHIQALLSLCFEGGERRSRELRLQEDEVRYIAEHCAVQLRPMGEQWYEVTFGGMS